MSAVGTERVSAVVGYQLKGMDFNDSAQYLPQRITIFAEANTANQADLDITPKQCTSAQQAGQRYGYGSPIHGIMRILKPINGGDLVGGIPIIVIPQEEPDGALATIIDITPVGVATGNGTHTLVICGRESLDGVRYDFSVEEGDTASDISDKMSDAINAVLGCPFSATSTDYETTATTKWKGFTASAATITVETGGNDLGITYSVNGQQDGSGTPDISPAITALGTAWTTLLVNGYGLNDTIMDLLEAYNGKPDPVAPSGQYNGIIMRPLIAITGNCDEDQSDITDARLNDVTIAVAPAPLSAGMQYEAAANMTAIFSRISQDTPHLDPLNYDYPDMPVPADGNIGAMASYDERDRIVKKGCSTVELVGGKYRIKDFVTTYHPVGETPPVFRYCRDLMIDFNIKFNYQLLEAKYVVGKAIVSDNDTVNVSGIIKPKMWKQNVSNLAVDLGALALIADVPFMQQSISVALSTSNPQRLQSSFRVKRSGIARILDTVAETGFNFG